MGRVYQDELQELSDVAGRLTSAALARLRAAVEAGSTDGIVVVASGGARVIAEWLCQLHLLFFGRVAASLTPIQYAALDKRVEGTTWFISATGSHPDIMHAARACIDYGSHPAAALIGRSRSPLAQFLTEHGHTHIVSLDHPSGMDGFLATNSIWSMTLALGHAYGVAGFGSEAALADISKSMLEWAQSRTLSLQRPDASIVVLHDGWTNLGALDFEVRCIEASLHRIWRADFRNFAHGRHFWLADRSVDSEVIALAATRAQQLAAATIAEIPSSIPVHSILVPYEGASAALASVAWSMYQAAVEGRVRNRDPGRPGVPSFGERLYDGRYAWPAAGAVPEAFELALDRKLGIASRALNDDEREIWRKSYTEFVDRLSKAPVQGLVFDFDGTLIETDRRFEPIEPDVAQLLIDLLRREIHVGIATGRGDSVFRSLVEAIPAELRGRVIVGYHNGATVRSLNECADDLDAGIIPPQIAAAARLLEQKTRAHGLGQLRVRPTQCTLTPARGVTLDALWSEVSALLLLALPHSGLRVLMSSHSIDVTLASASKLRVVEAVAKCVNSGVDEILRIGDKGAWPGNDSDLLNAPLGVSVDECSLDPATCWNVARRDCRGPRATVTLFKRIEPLEKGIRLQLGR